MKRTPTQILADATSARTVDLSDAYDVLVRTASRNRTSQTAAAEAIVTAAEHRQRQVGGSLSAERTIQEDDGRMASPAPRRRLPGSPFNAARDAIPPDEVFAVGDRVAHDRHGLGRVLSVSGTVAVDADFGSGTRRVSTPTSKMHKL